MNYSLAWLRDPAAGDALPGLLTGLVRDIRLILVHPNLGNAAKLAAITDAVDLLAPPPGPGAYSDESDRPVRGISDTAGRRPRSGRRGVLSPCVTSFWASGS